MDDTETDNTELFTLSQNYELGCAYNIDYPLNREESTDDVVDGAPFGHYLRRGHVPLRGI